MSGARLAFQRLGKRDFFDEHRTIGTIHFCGIGTEQQIDAGVSTKFLINFFWARVSLVIASRFKLERIHEDAHGYLAIPAGALTGNANQFAVRLV
jgi:hypothetical protein